MCAKELLINAHKLFEDISRVKNMGNIVSKAGGEFPHHIGGIDNELDIESPSKYKVGRVRGNEDRRGNVGYSKSIGKSV